MEYPFLLDQFLELENTVPNIVDEFHLDQIRKLLREPSLMERCEAGILKFVKNLVCQVKSSYQNAAYDYHDRSEDPKLRLLFTLYYDFPTVSATFKFVDKCLKSLDKSILSSLLSFTENVVLRQYLPLVGPEPLIKSKAVIFLDTLERIFDHLRVAIQLSTPHLSFMWRTLGNLFNLHFRLNCTSYRNFFKQVPDLFPKLSKFYLNFYKLISSMLLLVSESSESIEEEIDRNELDLFRTVVLDTLLLYNICFGVCVEALLTMIRLEYVMCRNTNSSELDQVELHFEVQSKLIQQIKTSYDKSKERLCTINILTMAVFLMEAERLAKIIFDSQAMDHLLREFFEVNNLLVDTYPDKQKSDYVYLIAFLYVNLTKLIHSTLVTYNKISREQLERIELLTNTVISFAHLHWSNNSIEQLYEATKYCILIRRILHQPPMFAKYLISTLYPQFFESRNSAAIYKLFGILFDAIGRESFVTILMPQIVGPLTLSQSLGHFLSHSILPSLEDPQSQDDFDFTLDFSQSASAICHESLRTVDFVRFLSIRFACISCEDIYQELLTIVKNHNVHCTFFFKSILPKLLQTVESRRIMQDPLQKLLKKYPILNLKPELFLTILHLNHRYNLDLLDHELKLVKSFIEQVALRHFDSDIWLQTLTLIIESKKSTEPISDTDTELIYHFLLSGSRIQQAAARDRMVTLFHKLFVRLEDSFKSRDAATCQLYCRFVQRIIRTCFEGLTPNKYFGTLLIFLRIIKLSLNAYLVPKLVSKKETLSKELICLQQSYSGQRLVCKEDLSLLVQMLQHSFDEIRLNAKEIIVICFQKKWFDITQSQFSKMANWSENLLKSIRPNEVQTGVVLMQLLSCCLHPGPNECLQRLEEITIELDRRVKSVEANILCSGDTSPTYPILSVMRAILCEEIDLTSKEFCNEPCHNLLSRIITSCIEACRAVASIVCNDSPEGHLPIDLSPITESLDHSSMPIKQIYVTSQKLLLNGWMTIKESVIILSHIVASFPPHQEDYPELCSSSQKVIDFLYENQLNLVHRGAFEQSSYAFNRLVSAVWKQNCSMCCSQIKAILSDIDYQLTQVEQEADSKYRIITRRSAGLPFIVQSILTSEPVVSLPNHCAGYRLIQSLIELLLPKSGDKKHSWQIIHSLNILRALVRDARLTDRMAPWIEPCIEVALRWFNPNTNCVQNYTPGCVYPIKNSSSMLFSAIITRIFGVKRNRQDTSRKNRMSCRLFFENYPSLYLLLNRQLLNASASALTTCSFIYPTLILLSRLTPAISDKNIHDISEYSKPMLNIIIKSCDIRLRQLTVRTYVQLLPLGMYHSVISQLYESILGPDGLFLSSVRANHRHGVLLLWAEMALQHSYQVRLQLREKNDDLLEKFSHIYLTLSRYFQTDDYGREPGPIQQAMHLVHCRIKWQKTLTDSLTCEDIINLLGTLLLSTNSDSIGCDGYYVNLLLNFLVHSLQHTDEDRVISFLKQLVGSNQVHLHEAKFVFWAFLNEILLMFHEDSNIVLMRHQCRNQESVFMAQLSELMHIVCCLREDGNLKLDLTRLIASATFHIDLISRSVEMTSILQSEPRIGSTQWNILNEIFILLYNIGQLGIVSNLSATIESILGLSIRQLAGQLDLDIIEETAHCSLVSLLTRCVVEVAQLDVPLWQRLVCYVDTLVHDEESLGRLTALRCLDLLLSKWFQDQFNINMDLKTQRFIGQLFSVLFTLLQDNEPNIRRAASKIASSLASFDSEQIESTSKFVVSYDLAIKSTAKLFVFTMRHSKYFAALMVELLAEHHPNVKSKHDTSDDLALFEKSELNIFKDPSLVTDSLIDQLTIESENKIEYLRSELVLLKSETETEQWIQDKLDQLNLVDCQSSDQVLHIFTS